MLTVILCPILGIYIAHRLRHYNSFFLDKPSGFLIGAFIGMLLSIFIGSQFSYTENYVASNITLASVRTTEGVEGAFIFGSGRIGDVERLSYFYVNKSGSLSPGSVKADERVHVVQDPSLFNEGFLRTIKRRREASLWVRCFGLFEQDRDPVVEQNFRVPVGTVMGNFSLK